VSTIRLLFFCLLFLFPFRNRLTAQSYDFVSYGVEQGLSQSNVTDILQDSRGYLWIGTYGGGLNRFDGISFREYSLKDSLPGQIISSLCEAPNGDIWVGTTWGGAGRYDGKLFENFNKENGLISNSVLAVHNHQNTVLLGMGAGGIYQYDYTTKQLKRISTLPNITAFCSDNKQRIWAGTDNALLKISNGQETVITFPGLTEKVISASKLTFDNRDLIYAGTNAGLFIYQTSTGKFIENNLTRLFKGKDIADVIIASDNTIMIAARNGELSIYNQSSGTYSYYNESNGLITGGIFCLYEDNAGKIWIGSNGNGLIRWRSQAFTYFSNIKGLNASDVFRIVEDSRKRIITGSYSQGLNCYENGKSWPILNGGKPFVQPVAVVEDKSKHIWVGHLNGVTELVNDRPVRTLIPGKRVRAVMQDSKGNMWFGTWEDGLYKYDGTKLEQFTKEKKQLPQNYIHSLLEDRKGRIWIGTGSGLVCCDNGKFSFYDYDQGLCNSYVGSLREDKSGNIWMHTDQCVSWFDGKTFHSITEDDGLLSNTTYFIEFDQNNRLWVGSNKGVDRVQLDSKNNVLSVYHYTVNNGFRGIECNSRAVLLDKAGMLWFGTIKGVIKYSPSQEKNDLTEPNTFLTSIRLFLEDTDWNEYGKGNRDWFNLPESIILPPEKNHLTFYFTSLQLHNPINVKYQFMLSGFDSAWQPVTSFSQITYSNLPPGIYRFHVKASNADGTWDKTPAQSGEINILSHPPPFWKTWWFYLLLAAIAGSVFYYFFFVRAGVLRKQREALETEIKLRTVEITKQNEEKSVMLKEIHHRVKNNLQVISSLLNLQADGITDKRVLTLFEDCRHRVNSMALIHEKMYQSHNLVNIDINSYIDELIHSLVDAYDTDKTIHLKTNVQNLPFRIDTIVPLGLILNEIISNAMKYAFRGLEEGNIVVTLEKTGENEYMLEAGDNGIGLPAEFNLKNASTLGMQLIMMLSEQLSGSVEMLKGQGTMYRITFREEVKDRF
jgi:two-component sensor histidine kinase/ligand-binding sensor domain-containing protein